MIAPGGGIVTEEQESLLVEMAISGRAIVLEPNGRFSMIATVGLSEAPIRERVFKSDTLAGAIQEWAREPQYVRQSRPSHQGVS